MEKAKSGWMATSISKNKVSLAVLPDTEVPFFCPSSQESSSACDEKFKEGNKG